MTLEDGPRSIESLGALPQQTQAKDMADNGRLAASNVAANGKTKTPTPTDQQNTSSEPPADENVKPSEGGTDPREGPAPDAEPFYPAFEFAESNLEAIAAAQIAAGLGDFNLESNGGGSDEGEQHDQTTTQYDGPALPRQDTHEDVKRGTKRTHGSIDGDIAAMEQSQPLSTSHLPNKFTTTSTENQAPQESNTSSSSGAETKAAAPTVAKPANESGFNKPLLHQNALSTSAENPSTTPTSATVASVPSQRPPAPAVSNPAPVLAPTASAPPTVSASPRPPPATSASLRPASELASSAAPAVKPIAPPIGTMPRPLPRPSPMSRPPTLFPRPAPSHYPRLPPNGTLPFRPRPPGPGPALPAAALFSATPPPGAPSFAALLSTLGPQDLAMVAHAAMGLDANGDPLPGNEESHKALAEAMRRLRESTSMRPPPPPPGHPQAFGPRPTPSPTGSGKAKTPRKSPSGSVTPKSVTPKPSRPVPLPIDPNNLIDALPLNQGNPLGDKRPLIAGPKPDRAPPKPGPPPEKRFQCRKCDRAFARAYNLNTHLSTHDPDPIRSKPFPCPYPSCKTEARSFSRKHDLQRHIASTHEAEPEPVIEGQNKNGEMAHSNLFSMGLGAPGRKFRCECGRAFVRRDALRRHNCEAMRAVRGNGDGNARGSFSGEFDELDDLANFDAVAASLTESVAAEMRAAQAHAAAREESDELDKKAERPVNSRDRECSLPEDDVIGDDEDAIENFASAITGDLNMQLGLNMDELEASEREQNVADSSVQQQQQNQRRAPSSGDIDTRFKAKDTASAAQVSPSVIINCEAAAERLTKVHDVLQDQIGTLHSPAAAHGAQQQVNDSKTASTKAAAAPFAPALAPALAAATNEDGDISLDNQQFENAAAEMMAQVTASIGAVGDAEDKVVEGAAADNTSAFDGEIDVLGLIPTISGLDTDDGGDVAAETAEKHGTYQPVGSGLGISGAPAPAAKQHKAAAGVANNNDEKQVPSGEAPSDKPAQLRIKQEDEDSTMRLAADTSIAA